MNALALIDRLRDRGIVVSRHAENLRAKGVADLLTDELRAVLSERKQELLAALAGDWFRAAGALLVRHVRNIPPDAWWALDGQFARHVRFGLHEGMSRDEAERIAYVALGQAVDRVTAITPQVGGGE